MSQERPIWYEPHPVTPERKAEIRAQGFVILDAMYAPSGWVAPVADAAKAADVSQVADTNKDGKVTAVELKAALTAAGVAFKSNASKAELQALYDGIGK